MYLTWFLGPGVEEFMSWCHGEVNFFAVAGCCETWGDVCCQMRNGERMGCGMRNGMRDGWDDDLTMTEPRAFKCL